MWDLSGRAFWSMNESMNQLVFWGMYGHEHEHKQYFVETS